ncbi:MAG: cytochrome d ubiquinol oxidase subunit II [Actinobacteria bacterium HGW-Actinobacteria-2]|nr:MAG: cytochrome d ubiquinol oxidase subunit II [Actinobacteria bacterium HGW-Actinobacteria-2]
MDYVTLQILWLILVAVLWIGYLVLEGFDYGVAMLVPFLGKTEKEKRVMVNTIGPVWDGNEVWLLTAGGATFAAFPAWYATLFSGAYLPLFLVLVGLIIRGVSFEYRAKHPETKWRNTFDWMAAIGSFIVPLVFGVAFANFIIGLPVALATTAQNPYLMAPAAAALYVITPAPYFWQLFSPFALLGGIVLVVAFLFHGAVYLTLKTKAGELHDRVRKFASTIGLVAIVGGAAYLLWQNLVYPAQGALTKAALGVDLAPTLQLIGWIMTVVAALGLIAAWWFVGHGREGIAFISTSVAILAVAVITFSTMVPGMGFVNAAGDRTSAPLNILNGSSSPETLTLMTIVAVIFVPIVLAYSAWTYWVFRQRLGVENMPEEVALAS